MAARGRRAWADGKRMSDNAFYGLQGWRTGDPNVPGQQQIPGTESGSVDRDARFERQRLYTDLPAGTPGKTSSKVTQADVEHGRHQKGAKVGPGMNDLGLDARSVRRRFGGLMDRAMERAQAQGSSTPQGQHFYGVTERSKIADAARRNDLPFETMTGMTAVTSPQVPWSKGGRDVNLGIAEDVARHNAAGLPGMPAVETGLPEMMEKAREIWDEGKTPYDVVKEGPKVKSFHQNFTHPYHPQGRGTVDTHMVGAAAPHITEKKDRESIIDRSGAYEYIDSHIRHEGSRRGLAVEEAQSVIWHQQKFENEQGTTGKNAHAQRMAKMASVEEGSKEIHGQRDIFGGEVNNPRPKYETEPDKVKEARARMLSQDQFRGDGPI